MLRYNLACTCSCLEITLCWVLPFGKRKIGLSYNFSSARQNELKIKRVILSRRSASSESSRFLQSNFKSWIQEIICCPPQETKKKGFGAWGRFGMSNNLPICSPFCRFSINSLWYVIEVDRIYVPVNMALALFHKHLQTNQYIFERGIGEIGFFFDWIAYWYCLLAPVIPLGITRAYWSH